MDDNRNDTMIQKRRLVAAKRLTASFDKGGLQISLPEETTEGLRLNLIQKYLRIINNDKHTKYSPTIEQSSAEQGDQI
jgi:hypothetical protein